VLGAAVGAEVLVVLRGAGPNFTASCSCFKAFEIVSTCFFYKKLSKNMNDF